MQPFSVLKKRRQTRLRCFPNRTLPRWRWYSLMTPINPRFFLCGSYGALQRMRQGTISNAQYMMIVGLRALSRCGVLPNGFGGWLSKRGNEPLESRRHFLPNQNAKRRQYSSSWGRLIMGVQSLSEDSYQIISTFLKACRDGISTDDWVS